MSDTFLTVLITALFGLDFAALLLAWHYRKTAESEEAGRDRALTGWRYSLTQWEECIELWRQDVDHHKAYEAALRRELATLRARKKHFWDVEDRLIKARESLFLVRAGALPNWYYKYDADENMFHWRKDCTEGNWGKYLQLEKEVRAHAETLA